MVLKFLSFISLFLQLAGAAAYTNPIFEEFLGKEAQNLRPIIQSILMREPVKDEDKKNLSTILETHRIPNDFHNPKSYLGILYSWAVRYRTLEEMGDQIGITVIQGWAKTSLEENSTVARDEGMDPITRKSGIWPLVAFFDKDERGKLISSLETGFLNGADDKENGVMVAYPRNVRLLRYFKELV